MFKATSVDKELVVDLLAEAFFDNKSFNAVVRQDFGKEVQIKKIFNYYFDLHLEHGLIYLSDDRKACAMISSSQLRRQNLKSLLMDLRLVFDLGIRSAIKGFRREKVVSAARPKSKYHYLLFLGVYPEYQNKGIGSSLLQDIITNHTELALPICLETSVNKNLPFYRKFGFEIYHQMNLPFPLYFMIKEV